MNTATKEMQENLARIEEARRALIAKGFRCLSGGKFGLPSYTDIEAWAIAGFVVYLIFSRKTGGWNLLAEVDDSNHIDATWSKLGTLMSQRIKGERS